MFSAIYCCQKQRQVKVILNNKFNVHLMYILNKNNPDPSPNLMGSSFTQHVTRIHEIRLKSLCVNLLKTINRCHNSTSAQTNDYFYKLQYLENIY